MRIFTQAKVSPAGSVNKTDLKRVAIQGIIFFAAPVIIYMGQLQGTLGHNGILTIRDLIPSIMTIGAIQGWLIGIIINFLLKFTNSSK